MTRKLNQLSALFFDSNESQARCRLCHDAQQVWVLPHGSDRAQMQATMDEIERNARAGAHVLLSLSYEAYSVFSAAKNLPTTHKPRAHSDISATPYLQAVAFKHSDALTPSQARSWLAERSQHVASHLERPSTAVTQAAFMAAVEGVRERIAAGQTYQVNVTHPYTSTLRAFVPDTSSNADAALHAVFAQLIEGLNVPFAGLFLLPESSLLSFSPELFFELSALNLTTRPMKGTAAVGRSAVETTQRAQALAMDGKNRAENLMIVDLMRNDVARLAQTTRVTVPDLFTVRPYGAVLQMTSTVRAQLSAQPSVFELFNALFPCGSITGAPKHETLRIIDAVEPFARGAYCGALGLIQNDPLNTEHLHAQFNVAIRTLELPSEPRVDALGIQHWPLQCSVGAGITYDSVAQDEWDECVLKSQFFARHAQVFELIETMRAQHDAVRGWFVPTAQLALHRQRMAHSADVLGFAWVEGAFEIAVQQACASTTVAQGEAMRLRLSLTRDGSFSTQCTELEILPEVLRFNLSDEPTHSHNPMLAHKTSMRAQYNRALSRAQQSGLFDTVFVNEQGELTEGARSVILVQIEGIWYTPPLSAGVLPSIARHLALADMHLKPQEHRLTPQDLRHAQAILLGNALYGLHPAQWVAS